MLMVKGVGTDLVEIARMKRAIDERGEALAKRILTDRELEEFRDSNRKPEFLAKRFAVKEAVSKALGTGMAQGVSWKNIELQHSESGQPIVDLSDKAEQKLKELGGECMYVSLSDEAGLVSAFAVLG